MAKEKETKLSVGEIVAKEAQNSKKMDIILKTGAAIKLSNKEEEELKKANDFVRTTVANIEKSISGVTNTLAMMESGKISASYKDIALLYAEVQIAMKSMATISKKAKHLVLTDPDLLDKFTYDNLMFTATMKDSEKFDSAGWKKAEPAEYNLIRSKYLKKIKVASLKYEALRGGE